MRKQYNYLSDIVKKSKEEKDKLHELLFEIVDNRIVGRTDLGTLIEVCATYGLPMDKVLSGKYENPELLDLLVVKYTYEEMLMEAEFDNEPVFLIGKETTKDNIKSSKNKKMAEVIEFSRFKKE